MTRKISVTELPDGRLRITMPPGPRTEVREGTQHGWWPTLQCLFEPYYTNGSYEPFDAGDGNPFVGLTSAPCIAESMTTAENGERTVLGKLWWFPDYMVRDPLAELLETGVVYFDPS